LAILDMQMPDMDGVQLAEEIRQLRGPTELPLILLSSIGRREASPHLAASLHKPIKPSQLLDAIMEVFWHHSRSAPPFTVPIPEPVERSAAVVHADRILLAEDNLVNQKVALLTLRSLGYQADLAANGREVLTAMEKQTYDVVLMDVQMPEMDGYEVTRRLLQLHPEASARPRIIAVTANAMEGDRAQCLAAGMDDYLSKPLKPAELREALARARELRQRSHPGQAPGKPA
jgi:CheY-like chemotaxis protein